MNLAEIYGDHLYLFTYGTLKRGMPGNELMTGATFIATVTKSNLRWIEGADYPTCIQTDNPADTVTGEIWEVPVADLPLLNEYEGNNYRLVQLTNSDGVATNLYAYLLKEEDVDKYVETT